jgi:cellulose synthase/poly-beta-1,6-N-acetylglucosamine synthase-like glycosyltransferase
MEGEALSTACVSGVCFAFRRKLVSPLDPGARTDDIHVALTASARGYRVRICRTAGAVEVRVPQTASELVRFRRRRGRAYLSELKNFSLKADAPLGWRIKRLISLWHFLVTPKVVVLLTVSACLLLGSPFWPWPIVALGAFALPSLTALAASRSLAGGGFRWWRLPLALGRLVVLTVVSMLTLRPQELSQSPFGGRA